MSKLMVSYLRKEGKISLAGRFRWSVFWKLLPVILIISGVGSVQTQATPGSESPDQVTSGITPWVVRIEALIDGRSELRLRGNTAQWFHYDFAAPGRHLFRDEPTIINGIKWQPKWPDIPDAENRFCQCSSDIFPGVMPPLPLSPGPADLHVIQSRSITRITQVPAENNDYTLVVQFDDNGINASDWYVVEIDFYPEKLPFDAFDLGTMGLWFGDSGSHRDGFSVSGHFSLWPWSDGINPPEETFQLVVGPAKLTIPPGAWVTEGSRFFWSGMIEESPVDVVIEDLGQGRFFFGVRTRLLDLTGFTNPEEVRLVIGNDEGTTLAWLSGRLDLNQGLVREKPPSH